MGAGQPSIRDRDRAAEGIPFGAKDIIDTRGLVTEYGSAIYRGRVGVEDADIIAELKRPRRGLIGKTQTTAFAYMTPVRHAIRATSITRPVGVRVARQRQSPPAWCRWRSERRPRDRCFEAGLLLVASPGSSQRSVRSQ